MEQSHHNRGKEKRMDPNQRRHQGLWRCHCYILTEEFTETTFFRELLCRTPQEIKILTWPTSFIWTITYLLKWKRSTKLLGKPINAPGVRIFSYNINNSINSYWCLVFFLVYLFIGEHIALVDFVKALHGLKVLANGDYTIISIDDFIFDPESNAQEYTSRSKYFSFIA